MIPELGVVSKLLGGLALFVGQIVPVQVFRVGLAVFVPQLLVPAKSRGGFLQVRGELVPVIVVPVFHLLVMVVVMMVVVVVVWGRL